MKRKKIGFAAVLYSSDEGAVKTNRLFVRERTIYQGKQL